MSFIIARKWARLYFCTPVACATPLTAARDAVRTIDIRAAIAVSFVVQDSCGADRMAAANVVRNDDTKVILAEMRCSFSVSFII